MAGAQFTQVILNSAVLITTANTNRDGTGTLGVLRLANTLGTGDRIDDIKIKARNAIAVAGMIRFFLRETVAAGGARHILAEVPVPIDTVGANDTSWEYSFAGLGWLLAPGWSIEVSTEKGDPFDISITNGGSFSIN
jgi:hypothetical protein